MRSILWLSLALIRAYTFYQIVCWCRGFYLDIKKGENGLTKAMLYFFTTLSIERFWSIFSAIYLRNIENIHVMYFRNLTSMLIAITLHFLGHITHEGNKGQDQLSRKTEYSA